MDKETIERYKEELMRMYKGSTNNVQKGDYEKSNLPENTEPASDSGKLIAMVTTISDIYPVPNAKVTVFTGTIDNMTPIDTDITDESGKTKAFELETPPKMLSMEINPDSLPYAVYNMLVEADGYVSSIHLNIPIFRGVTSLQRSNLLPLTASAEGAMPMVYDESSGFGL